MAIVLETCVSNLIGVMVVMLVLSGTSSLWSQTPVWLVDVGGGGEGSRGGVAVMVVMMGGGRGDGVGVVTAAEDLHLEALGSAHLDVVLCHRLVVLLLLGGPEGGGGGRNLGNRKVRKKSRDSNWDTMQ